MSNDKEYVQVPIKYLEELKEQFKFDGEFNEGYYDALKALLANPAFRVNLDWIDVKDEPLYTTDENGNWVCTEAGNSDFIAAIQYEDQRRPNEKLWWIHHCVIEDETGLCVVGDEENEPAGWDLTQVHFYKPFPKPPTQ